MPLLNWFRPRSKNALKPAARRPRARIGLEAMEDRTVPSWVSQIGGPGLDDTAVQETTDAAGNLYVSGYFRETAEFRAGDGTTVQRTAAGPDDGFVAKYSPDGSLLWLRTFGGPGADYQAQSAGPALDPSGAYLYLAGDTDGASDFTADLDGDDLANGGFVMKIRTADGAPEWVKGFAAATSMMPRAVTAADGFVYAVGNFRGPVDFDPGAGTYTLQTVPNMGDQTDDSFVVKLAADGSFGTAWAFGNKSYGDAATGVTVEGGSVLVLGHFDGTVDFDPRPKVAVNRTSNGLGDVYLASYTTAGALNWVRSFGGPGGESNYRMVASGDSVYLGGRFQQTVDFDPSAGTATLTSAGGTDAVVARYRTADGALVWARGFGGAGDDLIQVRPYVDPTTGLVFAGGTFNGAVDLNPGGFTGKFTSRGARDGFLVKLDAGGRFLDAWQFGGAGDDGSVRVIGSVGSTLYVTGGFTGTALLAGQAEVTTAPGNWDIYVQSLDGAAAPVPAPLTVSVVGGSVTEGSAVGGRVALTFTVSLSQPAGPGGVTLYYQTADVPGGATAGTDYEQAAGSVTFAGGETTATVPVWVLADTLVEADETFALSLLDAPLAGGGTAIGRALGTIVNDDAATGGKPRK